MTDHTPPASPRRDDMSDTFIAARGASRSTAGGVASHRPVCDAHSRTEAFVCRRHGASCGKPAARRRLVTDVAAPGPTETTGMLATVTFTPDPQIGMVPIADLIRDRLERFGLRVTHLDCYEATIEGEFDDIVDGLRSLGGNVIRQAGSHAVMHLHVT